MARPEVLVNVIVVTPSGVGCSAVAAGVNLGFYGCVDWLDDPIEKGFLAVNRRDGGAAGGFVDVILKNAVEVHGHVVEDVGEAFWDKAEVSSFSPDEEEKGSVEEFTTREVRSSCSGAAVVGDPDVRFSTKVGAPGGIVFENLSAETASDVGVKGVDVVRWGLDAHLRVSEEKNEVLTLVTDVVALETEEEAKPVEKVVAFLPRDKRRLAEVTDGAEAGHGGPHLREPKRRMLC